MIATFAPALPSAADVLPLSNAGLSPQMAARRASLAWALDFANLPDGRETPQAMQDFAVGTYIAFRPRNTWEQWLTERIALHQVRIERAERIERRLRDLQALRAIDCWEIDQVRAAQELGARLSSDPKRICAELWCTPAGCTWMIEQWETLDALPATAWTEAQRTLVEHLCPARPDQYLVPGFARLWIGQLEMARDRLQTADAGLRALTVADFNPEPSRLLAALRRYTRWLHRQIEWYVTQLRIDPPNRNGNPDCFPRFVLPDEPEAAPAQTNPSSIAETNPSSTVETNPSLIAETNPSPAAPAVTQTNPRIATPIRQSARTNPRSPRR